MKTGVETAMMVTAQETRTAETKAPCLRMPDWGAAGWAGLIAGTVLMLSEISLLPFEKGGNAWVPVRMVAAIVFGRQALPPPPYFIQAEPGSGVFFMALALHFSLALIYLRFLSTMIYKLDRKTAALAGAFFGLILYAVNFYGFTAAFPWFAAARGWVSAFSSILFGLVAAASYKALERREPLIEDERDDDEDGPQPGGPEPFFEQPVARPPLSRR
jgi:hypothetical protein